MRYSIPCVKANSTKCFPKAEVDKAMAEEEERLGNNLSEHWYSCFDIMRLFGSERIMNMMETLGIDEDTPIDAKILSGAIENAQKTVEGRNCGTEGSRAEKLKHESQAGTVKYFQTFKYTFI
mgnify:CR=1 FL=1